MKLDWLKRPRHDQTLCARRTIWETRDRQYRVVCSTPLLSGLTVVYYAIVRDAIGERIISKHRKRGPAVAACEDFAKRKRRKT